MQPAARHPGTPVSRMVLALVVAAGFCLAGFKSSYEPLTAEEWATVDRIEAYINSIETATARFLQVANNGAVAEGTLYLKRPGRLRMEYDPPSPLLIIANGTNLVVYDDELEEQDRLDLSATPASILTRSELRFRDHVAVLDVEQAAKTVRVTVADKKDPDAQHLTLIFSDEPLLWRGWRISDPVGGEVRVGLSNLYAGAPLDPRLFDLRPTNP